MKKYRISTTISAKHRELLNKHAEDYGSQQLLLERALECLDNGPNLSPCLSMEEEIWGRVGRELKTGIVVVPKELLKLITDTYDIERYKQYNRETKPYETALEFFYQKPLRDCSLPEIINGLVALIRLQNSYVAINCSDEGDRYELSVIHKWGTAFSDLSVVMCESLFDTYGVKAETVASERSIFMKIYKK